MGWLEKAVCHDFDEENSFGSNKRIDEVVHYYSYHIVYYMHTKQSDGSWSIDGPLRITQSLFSKIESDHELENIEKDIKQANDPLGIEEELKIIVTDFKLLREDWM